MITKKTLASKENSEKKQIAKEVYNVKYLDQIFDNSPQLLNKYPLFKVFYSDTGKKRSFLELIAVEEGLKKQGINTSSVERYFNEFYSIIIREKFLIDLNIYELTEDEQFKIISKIFDLIKFEIKEVIKSINVIAYKIKVASKKSELQTPMYNAIEKEISKKYKKINHYRISKLNYLFDYLKSNKDLINKLSEKDWLEDNPRNFCNQREIIQSDFTSLKNKIRSNEIIKEIDYYQELLSMNGVEYDGPKL